MRTHRGHQRPQNMHILYLKAKLPWPNMKNANKEIERHGRGGWRKRSRLWERSKGSEGEENMSGKRLEREIIIVKHISSISQPWSQRFRAESFLSGLIRQLTMVVCSWLKQKWHKSIISIISILGCLVMHIMAPRKNYGECHSIWSQL